MPGNDCNHAVYKLLSKAPVIIFHFLRRSLTISTPDIDSNAENPASSGCVSCSDVTASEHPRQDWFGFPPNQVLSEYLSGSPSQNLTSTCLQTGSVTFNMTAPAIPQEFGLLETRTAIYTNNSVNMAPGTPYIYAVECLFNGSGSTSGFYSSQLFGSLSLAPVPGSSNMLYITYGKSVFSIIHVDSLGSTIQLVVGHVGSYAFTLAVGNGNLQNYRLAGLAELFISYMT